MILEQDKRVNLRKLKGNCSEKEEKTSSKTWSLKKLLGSSPFDKNETLAQFATDSWNRFRMLDSVLIPISEMLSNLL